MPPSKRSRTKTKTSAAATVTSRKYTRPGVEAAARLLSLPRSSSTDEHRWNVALTYYESMLRSKGGETLVHLDERRNAIAREWNSVDNTAYLTKDQLMDVILKWKFAKGKPRNALIPLLQSNSPQSVMEYSKRALEYASSTSSPSTKESSDVQDEGNTISLAIKELCHLKGVGPATASAILSMHNPDIFAFMDDEVIECLYEGKRGYTLKIYEEVNARCMEIAGELNSAAGPGKGGEWTPYQVGQVLWTVATMKAWKEEEGLSEVFEEREECTEDLEGEKKSKRKR
ncbi:hypothetical protein HJC23_010166 [Cyclotella cryptica]|uniref:HhH-GPD domain-containing protein n=1 Tax=Cyclotella cryptica TaxID=29204 RepID=A0ABD3P4K7_9STRA